MKKLRHTINTVAAWPQGGIRYAACFILEYALWVWLALLLFVFIRKFSVSVRAIWVALSNLTKPSHGNNSEYKAGPLIILITCSALIAHTLYYTLIIGGDHFEYRIYSHLILLIFVSFVWLLNKVNLKAYVSILFLVIFVLASYPVPWTHWFLSQNKEVEANPTMSIPISDHWPKPFRWYAQAFDNLQVWMIEEHYTCIRHHQHKLFHAWQTSRFPVREQGFSLPANHYPVMAEIGVGVAGWALPKINIIDVSGLNDFVIARTPANPNLPRHIAHDRIPPKGYVESFRPNVYLVESKEIRVLPRKVPLSREDIIKTEKIWAEKIKKLQ